MSTTVVQTSCPPDNGIAALTLIALPEAQLRRQEGEAEAYELSTRSWSAANTQIPLEVPSEPPVDTKKMAQVQLVAFTALSWAMFMQGWNDGTYGPLLPAMQRHYNVR